MNKKFHIYHHGQRITSSNSPMELSPTQIKHYEAAGYILKEDVISDEAKARAKEIEVNRKIHDNCACQDCVQFRVRMH